MQPNGVSMESVVSADASAFAEWTRELQFTPFPCAYRDLHCVLIRWKRFAICTVIKWIHILNLHSVRFASIVNEISTLQSQANCCRTYAYAKRTSAEWNDLKWPPIHIITCIRNAAVYFVIMHKNAIIINSVAEAHANESLMPYGVSHRCVTGQFIRPFAVQATANEFARMSHARNAYLTSVVGSATTTTATTTTIAPQRE